jgi:hypothetical protein
MYCVAMSRPRFSLRASTSILRENCNFDTSGCMSVVGCVSSVEIVVLLNHIPKILLVPDKKRIKGFTGVNIVIKETEINMNSRSVGYTSSQSVLKSW